jgi:hypothetical protein
MTPSAVKSLRTLVRITFAWGIFLTGCVAAPRTLGIPGLAQDVRPPPYGSKDYPAALAAITSVMVRDLQLPAVQGSVTIYFSQAAYESGVVAESEQELARLRQLLGARANRLSEEQFISAAQRFAVGSVAIGMYKKVLINDWRVSNYPWPEWIRVLAHELTHTVAKDLVEGRPTTSDQWLNEGFADWVGYKVVDAFGAENFALSRKRALDEMASARYYQTFPSLSQLARNSEWLTWSRTLGRAATYGQALIAVDLLIEEKGVPAIVKYFRLFRRLSNRERNFTLAFGEPMASFDERFGKHLEALLGRSDRTAALH